MVEENRADKSFPHVDGGFNFENFKRNVSFMNSDSGIKGTMPKAWKTGTTIVGVVFDGGVALAADTRATGNVIVDKNCEKIHYIAPNIYCCGAGTAADTEMTVSSISILQEPLRDTHDTGQISSQLELLRLNTAKSSRVVTAMTMLKRHLFNYQGHVSAALVLGGVDATGPHLYTVYPHGSTDKLPYVTMGSGSLAAMSVFETSYKDNLTEQEAIDLVAEAIKAGIFNDLGSGSNVDVCIITKDKVDMKRNFITPNDQGPLRASISKPATFGYFPPGTTKVVSTDIETFATVTTDVEMLEA
ncbi:Proteasome subunit beta type-7 [Hondaea fermentalgiana]|uniref:Proteasome subunit beta type-7 n=1 Tax=Hondaea fermentalgiana TaxID=2315210 RepID=A0A2R5GT34_9STRA|nr:Proteasome subunit beta type-7 [Hondaea fermentalgiana]|eukprot:GBG31813.1 Proteasome subunit beta type-7 [Hondaea fermentalgiana]